MVQEFHFCPDRWARGQNTHLLFLSSPPPPEPVHTLVYFCNEVLTSFRIIGYQYLWKSCVIDMFHVSTETPLPNPEPLFEIREYTPPPPPSLGLGEEI